MTTQNLPMIASGNSYNYYPNTMIKLSSLAYADVSDIESGVNLLGLSLVWGPVYKGNDWRFSDSLMYVVCNNSTNEYTVVIRGTNPVSVFSWLTEDFDIATTKPFSDFVPTAPANALLSKATYNGLNDLLALSDSGASVVDFLKSVNPRFLYVTGHSLGGTLVAPMFAYLNDQLYGGGFVHNMADWAFAGITPGNSIFADYYNSLGNPEFAWRIHNPLDIVPLLFPSGGVDAVKDIYDSYGLKMSLLDPIRLLLDHLFDESAKNNYTQPLGDQVLTAEFNEKKKDFWIEQAGYQHHSTTYEILVAQEYPL